MDTGAGGTFRNLYAEVVEENSSPGLLFLRQKYLSERQSDSELLLSLIYKYVSVFSFAQTMIQQKPPFNPNLSTHPPPGLSLDSEWVTLLFTIFPIRSQVFGLAGCLAFSFAIIGLLGFSNGAFEEITLFSWSSREKAETFGQHLMQSITQAEFKLCLTHLATKISSYLVCVEV